MNVNNDDDRNFGTRDLYNLSQKLGVMIPVPYY